MADQPRVSHACPCEDCRRDPQGPIAHDHQAINRVVTLLDERRRRLFAGLLARQAGHGGVVRVARITGLSRTTILRGLRELDRPANASERVRRPGGGRPRLEKKRPRS
jgi:DNA-binding phage protein